MKNGRLVWLVFVVNPLLASIFAMREWHTRWAKHILILFCSFLGLTFIPFAESMDAHTYVARLKYWEGRGFQDLVDFIVGVITFSGEDVDFFEEIIYIFVNAFNGGEKALFATFSFIFGYFYVRNLIRISSITYGSKGFVQKFFFLALILVIPPVSGINQFRFWTASMIMLSALLNLEEDSKKKTAGKFILAIIVHFGMYLPVFGYVVVRLFGSRLKLYLIISLLSLAFSAQSFLTADSFGILGEALNARITNYSDMERIEATIKSDEGNVWYAKLWKDLILYTSYFLLTVVVLRYGKRLSPFNKTFVSVTLLVLALSNLISFIPVSERYYTVAFFLVFAVLLFVDRQENLRFNRLLSLPLVFPVSLKMMISIFFLLRALSYNVLISNPFVLLIANEDVSIGSLIGIN